MALRWSTVPSTDFKNSWANHGPASYNPAQYTKDDNGILHLRGMLTPGTNFTEVFRLPVGFRPFTPTTVLGAIGARSGSTTVESLAVLVGSAGDVTIFWASGVALLWVSLDGLSCSIAPAV